MRSQFAKYQLGALLMESIVTIFVASTILGAAVVAFSLLARTARDSHLKTTAHLQAQAVIDMMTPEIRMIGNGVPFHQANFLINQAGLSNNTVTQPIIVSGSTTSQIKFRINTTGETYLLTANYDPVATSTITLTSVSKIVVGDQIYITNATVGDDDGLWATVQSINTAAKTLTFSSGYQYKSGATFAAGSLLEVVPTVTYTSTSNYGGITRDEGFGAQTLASTGQFTLTYLNSAGSALDLPLVPDSDEPFPANAIQNVHSIRINAKVRSARKLSAGSYYVADITQSIGVRNLNFKY